MTQQQYSEDETVQTVMADYDSNNITVVEAIDKLEALVAQAERQGAVQEMEKFKLEFGGWSNHWYFTSAQATAYANERLQQLTAEDINAQ